MTGRDVVPCYWAALVVASGLSIWLFFALMALFVLVEAAIRPYGTDIVLSQVEGDAGSASSFINFLQNILGVVGMGLITLMPLGYIAGIGLLTAASLVAAIALWIFVLRSKSAHIGAFDK